MSGPDLVPFFKYAEERENIRIRRLEGGHRPYTEDPILGMYRFCNVNREHDTTTIWFRDNVRERMRSMPEVLMATVLFRWFNRITTGEAMFVQPDLSGRTAWEKFLADGDSCHLSSHISTYCGKGPYVTGSYIIKTPNGLGKLHGVLQCVEWLDRDKRPFDAGAELNVPYELHWRQTARACLDHRGSITLEAVWEWLRQFRYMGDFMAYEVVTDLYHTDILCDAPDIMTWANPGPGARRGLNRIHGRSLEAPTPKAQLIQEMRDILHEAHLDAPTKEWDMRTVEHTLCEFDKYQRALLGQGRPRQVFR